MLALQHSRRQQPFAFSHGLESSFHDPYLSQNLISCGPFDPTFNMASLPFSFYDCSTLSTDAPTDPALVAMFPSLSNGTFRRSSPSSELPPPTLSNASAASIPSNTPSIDGSPYPAHAQACSGQEPWNSANQELGLGPQIMSNEGYDQGFGGADLDSEMTFSMHSKVAEDFVGEYSKLSPKQSQPSTPTFPQQPLSFSSPISAKSSCRRDCATLGSVLAQAECTIRPRDSTSLAGSPSFTVFSGTPENNPRPTSQHSAASFQFPSNPLSSLSKRNPSSPSFSSATSALAGASLSGKQPINLLSFDKAAILRPAHAGRFLSQFSAQSSGNYVLPIESSRSFILVADALRLF